MSLADADNSQVFHFLSSELDARQDAAAAAALEPLLSQADEGQPAAAAQAAAPAAKVTLLEAQEMLLTKLAGAAGHVDGLVR